VEPEPAPVDPSPPPETRIRLVLNGCERVLPSGTRPTMPLLDWLRGPEGAGLTGAKEGCAEGDCGACTVVFEEPDGGRAPVNACLCLLGQAHGRAIRTVEGLRGVDGGPHPVARALAEADATQCGFCTPGIVMAAWAWTREGGDPHEALAGNLCRCTGYRPILEAMDGMAEDGKGPPAPEPPAPAAAARFEYEGGVFHLPTSLAEALALRAALPGAWLLAGGTDLGLRVSEGRERPAEVIALQGVLELRCLERHDWGFRVGAGVTYARLMRALRDEPGFAPLLPVLARFGSRQIRGLGTIGGNLGTASPIGDALPPLLALAADVELASMARGVRRMAVDAFLLGHRRNALAPNEVILAVTLPRPAENAFFACEKLSRRHDQDISAVSLSALLRFGAEDAVAEARLAFGGMGPRAARAVGAEAALAGRAFDAAAVGDAVAALARDFSPLTDWRGGAAWRMAAAQGLLRRLHLRHARPDLPPEVHALEVRA
jgi:xanthine dehydrogenase small subunit